MKAKDAFIYQVVTDQAESKDCTFNYGISDIVNILYITGMCSSEICALKVTVINTSSCYLWVLQNCRNKTNISKTR